MFFNFCGNGLMLIFYFCRMGLILHQHGHSHGGASHGHSHGHSHGKDENINVRAAYIHVIGDFIQSVGVLVAALIIYFKVKSKTRNFIV